MAIAIRRSGEGELERKPHRRAPLQLRLGLEAKASYPLPFRGEGNSTIFSTTATYSANSVDSA